MHGAAGAISDRSKVVPMLNRVDITGVDVGGGTRAFASHNSGKVFFFRKYHAKFWQ